LPCRCCLGLLLDRLLGEPPHSSAGRFRALCAAIERLFRRLGSHRGIGLLAWSAAMLPWVALAGSLREATSGWAWLLDVGLLYFAIGSRSLAEHARAVATPLMARAICPARASACRGSSPAIPASSTSPAWPRPPSNPCSKTAMTRSSARCSGLRCLGGPGALMFRLANTLDAMWGYRNERYLRFGWAAARIDDVLNFIPARLTALSYALLGNTADALRCWRTQAPTWDSPNAGPVMAAGAGALDVCLGGPAIYHGQLEEPPASGHRRAGPRRRHRQGPGAGSQQHLAVAAGRGRRERALIHA
jgi:adenosylcobinamide-phosphate synthase